MRIAYCLHFVYYSIVVYILVPGWESVGLGDKMQPTIACQVSSQREL